MEKPTPKELLRFDPKTYVKLIKYLGQIYKIVPFCEIPKEDIPYLVLRHDVDVSLISALKMAQMEHDMGVRSTYFIWLSSKFYNSLEGKNVCIIEQISKLDHEIGLHYDTSQYECYGLDDIHVLNMEIQVLENLLGRKVNSISCHSPRGPISFIEINGYKNADDPHLTDIYVHDSRKLWTVKSLSILLNNPPKRVQLLTHPCHWEGKINRRTKLDESLQNLLWLLYKIRTLTIRVIHSRESCEN